MKSKISKYVVVTGFFVLSMVVRCKSQPLWDLANQKKNLLRVSTLFTAQNVRDHLSSEEGLGKAVDWCKKTGVTHVFIESYRDNYTAERSALLNAKAKFKAEGFDVSGW